jgi:hypothetical protein
VLGVWNGVHGIDENFEMLSNMTGATSVAGKVHSSGSQLEIHIEKITIDKIKEKKL